MGLGEACSSRARMFGENEEIIFFIYIFTRIFMKKTIIINLTLGATFIAAVMIFVFANQASKILEVHNPVKTVQQQQTIQQNTANVVELPEVRSEANN